MSLSRMYMAGFLYLMLIFSSSCYADSCKNASGSVQDTHYDFTTTLSQQQDNTGATTQLIKSGTVGVRFTCPRQWVNGPTYRSYLTNLTVNENDGNWQYLKINNHLEGALKITDSVAGDFYPPANYVKMGGDDCLVEGCPTDIKDGNLTLQLKVLLPFIGQTIIPPTTMFTVYVTTTNKDSLTTPVYTISYGGTITVPQSCTINSGETLNVQLGSIKSSDFKTMGEMPASATVKTVQIPITCNGSVSSTASLSLRLIGARAVDVPSALATDNPDIGVQVTDSEGNNIMPNTGLIPFNLADDRANVTMNIFPVSATGNAPAEGEFHALAYLKLTYN